MSYDKSVAISISDQWLIHGQVGNIFARVSELRQVLNDADLNEFQVYVRAIEIEAEYLKQYLPSQPSSPSVK